MRMDDCYSNDPMEDYAKQQLFEWAYQNGLYSLGEDVSPEMFEYWKMARNTEELRGSATPVLAPHSPAFLRRLH